MNLSSDEKCGIEAYNINAGAKNVDKNCTSNLASSTKENDETFKAELSSNAVKPFNQTAYKCNELAFPTSSLANKKLLANKYIINYNTSLTSTKLF